MKNNPWIDRRIVAWAHQGGAFEGPSSTLFAIGQALERGAAAVELDVHATKDRKIVVCHDETVDRTTGHQGEICNFTLAEIQEMDNAYWWIEGDAATAPPVNSSGSWQNHHGRTRVGKRNVSRPACGTSME